MNFKIIFFVSILFLAGCQNANIKKNIPPKIPTTTEIIEEKSKNHVVKEKIETTENEQGFITNQKYSNSGFTLIYDDKLMYDKEINKKINNSELEIFHKKIFKNSFVKIINPENNKSVIAKVISNDDVFSDFYNSVITKRIVNELSLNPNYPYIELILFSKETTFVAKKAKTFEEEKHVADKAPVDGIVINNLGSSIIKKNNISPQKFIFSIKIADFYFKDSAENMIKRIEDETSIKNSMIKKLSNTKYRVLIGPFNDIKNLEKSFNELKPLGFDNIEILRNV